MFMMPLGAAVVALLLAVAAPVCAQSTRELRDRATDLTYNLDHDEAIRLLRQAVAAEPSNPANHKALAATIWMNILFRSGAVTVDHYLGSFSRSSVDIAKPPAALDAEFRSEAAKAVQLAEQRVAAAPKDATAHQDLGSAVGLQASYMASVEGKLLAGFKAARRSYDECEQSIALDPSRKEAGLVVGTYRYIVSTLSLPMRLMAYVAGFGGGRERGLHLVEETAASGAENRTDAEFALILLYNREQRFDDALRVLGTLRKQYPRNRLVVLEAGATALRANRPQDADGLLTDGLKMLAADTRTRMPGEEALWHYKRGAARVMLKRPAEARADLAIALKPELAAVGPGARAPRDRASRVTGRRPRHSRARRRECDRGVSNRQRSGLRRRGAKDQVRWRKVKTWVWVVIGVITLGILCIVAMAAAGLWFVKSHVDMRTTTVTAATLDFDTVRAKFTTQKPLIELDDEGDFVRANTERPAGTVRPQTLNVMAFDTSDEKVVRMELPFWMLRLKIGRHKLRRWGAATWTSPSCT